MKKKKYIVSGEKRNIITKIEGDSWVGIICENNLEELKEYKWKIKFLKFKYVYIIFGVVPLIMILIPHLLKIMAGIYTAIEIILVQN